MKITVKKLKTIDIEKLLEKHNIDVLIEEQQPHGALKCKYRMSLKNALYRNPRTANFGKCLHWCQDPEDREGILIDLADMLNWKIIQLPDGREVGPFVVTCKHEDNRP
jgi:hypothetical protein